MNRKNISIMMSVFIASFVISILGYIVVEQKVQFYTDAVKAMPEDITLYNETDILKINKIRNLDNIKVIGLKGKEESLKYGDRLFELKKYDHKGYEINSRILENGRFPEHKGEILLSKRTMKDLNLKIGDRITLDRGTRMLKGEELAPDDIRNDNESFISSGDKTYTVTGITASKDNRRIDTAYSLAEGQDKYYLLIKVENIFKIYGTKAQIEKIAGSKNYVIMNDRLLNFFNISERGVNIKQAFTDFLMIPIILVAVFTVMIKNIYNIWGIYKIKEYSMYKSVGATNRQIYKILLREVMKISIIPMILGEISAYGVIKLILIEYQFMESMFISRETARISMDWIPFIVINIILLLVIVISATFPTRTISKVEILEGLKGNFKAKNFKKKRRKNLFKELKVNNRKTLRSAMLIMTAGLFLVGFLIGIYTMNKYNNLRHLKDDYFNLTVKYSTDDNRYPEIYDEIIKKFRPEDSKISIEKNLYIDMKRLNFSPQFKKIGLNSGFESIFYEPGLLYGKLEGIDEKRFKEISDSKDNVVLINLVQEDIRDFYSEANFIPYLSSNTDEIYYRNLPDFKDRSIHIDRIYDKFYKYEDEIDPYTVVMATSIDNFRKIVDKSKSEFEEKNMKFPTIYYYLNMRFKAEDLEKYTSEINKIMENSVSAREKYSVNNTIIINSLEKMSEKSMYFLGILFITTTVILNVANAYSSSNLAFFNRKQEIGSLLSCGMDRKSLEKMLLKDMRANIYASVLSSAVLTSAVMGLLIMNIPYVNIVKYIEILPIGIAVMIIALIVLSSYAIYFFAMKKVTGRKVIELIKSED